MTDYKNINELLKKLPAVDKILEIKKKDPIYTKYPRALWVKAIRETIEKTRAAILKEGKTFDIDSIFESSILKKAEEAVIKAASLKLVKVINGTGVVIHTNLGRSVLPYESVEHISKNAYGYCNLEFELAKGKRGSRHSITEDIICEISGAESAAIVNNNAGGVLLCLDTLAYGKKVIVSRGELIEIGGSFRLPDVMAKSGCILTEVGTTNRTHLEDYKKAIDAETSLILKVHTSNYHICGFTASVDIESLTRLGKKCGIPVMEDLGSGCFIDFSDYGLAKEPTVQESLLKGADVVTFSGDKLLGGPQAGIIAGKKHFIEKIKENPLSRALRTDKLTLAALEKTLYLYRNPETAIENIPTLKMVCMPIERIEKKAENFMRLSKKSLPASININIIECRSKAGGGSLPLLDIASKGAAISIEGFSAAKIEDRMRKNSPPVIGRVKENIFIIDFRTIEEDDFSIIIEALSNIFYKSP